MSIEVQPLTSTIGAEVTGVDLAGPLDSGVVDELRAALLDHLVLVFRDQRLDEDAHVAFARRFGPVSEPPVRTRHGEARPEINVLDQVHPAGEGADNWHADNTYTATPPMGSTLRAVRIPSVGGDTMFANMYAAYEALSPPMRALCDRLTAVHDVSKSMRKAIAYGNSDADLAEMQRRLPPVEHPVVRRHPETGRCALFVNVNSTTHLVGLPERESDTLLDLLHEHTRTPDFQLRVRWDEQTFVFFDNRCTQHYAVPDYHERRIMHRVTIAGARPD